MSDELQQSIQDLARSLAGHPTSGAKDVSDVVMAQVDMLVQLRDPETASTMAKILYDALRENPKLAQALADLPSEQRGAWGKGHRVVHAYRRLEAMAKRRWERDFQEHHTGRRLSGEERHQAMLVHFHGADLLAGEGFPEDFE